MWEFIFSDLFNWWYQLQKINKNSGNYLLRYQQVGGTQEVTANRVISQRGVYVNSPWPPKQASGSLVTIWSSRQSSCGNLRKKEKKTQEKESASNRVVIMHSGEMEFVLSPCANSFHGCHPVRPYGLSLGSGGSSILFLINPLWITGLHFLFVFIPWVFNGLKNDDKNPHRSGVFEEVDILFLWGGGREYRWYMRTVSILS